jgi:hypothetical protein
MWVITAWQHMSPGVIVKGFKKCCISSATDEIDDMLWYTREEDGNVRSVRRMKALTVQMETVTLIDKGTLNLTYFVYYVHEIHSTILFFLADFYWGGRGHCRFG